MKHCITTKDYSISLEEFQLVYDSTLDMLATRPTPVNLENYYQSEDYISHTDASKSFVDKLYQLVKRYALQRKMALLERFGIANKSVLDIGAGTGDFLLAATKKGWRTYGIEPNKKARHNAFEKGIALAEGWEELTNRKYQVITLWHVLEHLPNLEAQIERITQSLEERGTLIIAVPNFKSFDATYYKEYWAAYDVPRHLWHFSRTAISVLFAKQGLRVMEVKPMFFDSFYVSLLSEKYKFGKQNYFRAFWIGLRSNLHALRSKEYSSLIYILQKD